MAYEIPGLAISLEAAADLSALQFTAIRVDGNGKAAACTADVKFTGVLQNDPNAAGKAATVMVSGVTKWVSSATIAAGASVVPTTGGKAVATTTAGLTAAGIVLTGGAADEYLTVLLTRHVVAAPA